MKMMMKVRVFIFFLIIMFKIYARAIILNKKNQVLLLKKNNKQNL